MKAGLFCADPHFDQNKPSINLVSCSIKFLLSLQSLFESTFLDWTLLRWPVCDKHRYTTYFPYADSHSSLRNLSGEFISPNMCIYIYLHGHIKIPTIFFSWVGGGLRCHTWGCTKKLDGPCAIIQSWFSARSVCLSASISGISGRIENTTFCVSQDIQIEPRTGT